MKSLLISDLVNLFFRLFANGDNSNVTRRRRSGKKATAPLVELQINFFIHVENLREQGLSAGQGPSESTALSCHRYDLNF